MRLAGEKGYQDGHHDDDESLFDDDEDSDDCFPGLGSVDSVGDDGMLDFVSIVWQVFLCLVFAEPKDQFFFWLENKYLWSCKSLSSVLVKSILVLK